MEKILAKNPTAYHNYSIESTLEAGIVLTGTEIKSIRNGKANLKDTYVNIKNGEVFIYGMHISPYEFGNIYNQDPLRNRKLLLHKKEINKLVGALQDKGVTLIPLKMYIKHGYAKVLLGLAKGKHQYDKREAIKRREQNREIERVMKHY